MTKNEWGDADMLPASCYFAHPGAVLSDREKPGNFAYNLYPNYEQVISGVSHFRQSYKSIDSLPPCLIE
jgi:hypothetical protein